MCCSVVYCASRELFHFFLGGFLKQPRSYGSPAEMRHWTQTER